MKKYLFYKTNNQRINVYDGKPGTNTWRAVITIKDVYEIEVYARVERVSMWQVVMKLPLDTPLTIVAEATCTALRLNMDTGRRNCIVSCTHVPNEKTLMDKL